MDMRLVSVTAALHALYDSRQLITVYLLFGGSIGVVEPLEPLIQQVTTC